MTLARTALAVIAMVAILVVVVRLLEPRLAFFPFAGETTTPRDFGVAYESLTIDTADGERLRAWLIPSTPARALILYFHGNGGNLSNWTPILTAIARQGYTVLAFDYRGYGVSSGRPTEKGLYRDVDAVVDYVWTTMKPTAPVIYWGRSLGVSMAAYAASRQRRAGLLGPPSPPSRADLSGPPSNADLSGPPGTPSALILESGFPDARSLFRAPSPMVLLALFSTYRFPAARFLRDSQVPVLVMHGDADTVIPYEQGRALYERIGGPKQFFTMRGADHNGAAPPDERAYWTAIRDFTDQRAGVNSPPHETH
jgi:alpha-beta hydrolase superfamily lysophospholipase